MDGTAAPAPGRTDWELREYARDHGGHARVASGHEKFARFIADHPDAPLAAGTDQYLASVAPGTDDERLAAVDAFAAENGVRAGWNLTLHRYEAVLDFDGFEYVVFFIPAMWLDNLEAADSYRPNLTLAVSA